MMKEKMNLNLGVGGEMKHLKLFEQHENVDITGLIRAWLSALGVEENQFVINPDWSISTDCAIEIPNGFLTKIPIKFKELNIEDAYFQCMDNKLKTLENFPSEGSDVEITYCGNPCSEDENQFKWLNPTWMSKGIIYNVRTAPSKNNVAPYQFKFTQSIMDDYWNEILQTEPELFINLEVNKGKFSLKSNHISSSLVEKYKYIDRGNKVWDIKTK